MLVLVASMTAAVYLISSQVQKTYEAQARIVVDDRPGGFEPGDVDTIKRRLATVQALLTTRRVLAGAARRLSDESASSLEDKVTSSVDESANIVDVKGRDDTPTGAAAIANAVARAFLALDVAAERQRLAGQRGELLRALTRARGAAERRVIREQLSQLSISGSAAGSAIVLAEPARPPTEASSPRPIRNAIFAFVGSVFLAVLAALALGQLAPRVSGARELARLVGAPVVAAVGTGRHGRTERALAESACRELRASLAPQLRDDVKTLLVAGDLPGRAKSAVAAGLSRALAGEGGSRVLLISADLRNPRAHDIFDAPRSPGLSDVLEAMRKREGERLDSLLEEAIVGVADGALDLLPAGSETEYASAALAGEAAAELFAELKRSGYQHLVVEGPALLGGVEASLLARHADALLVVCSLDRLSPADAGELGELVSRLGVQAVGLVVLGGFGGSGSVTVAPWPGRPHVRVEA
jgi:Mrp family chromosome partitioning ATPase